MIEAEDDALAGLAISNLGFAEEIYFQYLRDPASVDASWRDLFEAAAREARGGAPDGNGHAAGNGQNGSAAGGQNGQNGQNGTSNPAAGAAAQNGAGAAGAHNG